MCTVYVQGLEVGDEIVQFGSISAANFVNMQSIAGVVQHSKGVSLVHSQSIAGVVEHSKGVSLVHSQYLSTSCLMSCVPTSPQVMLIHSVVFCTQNV